MPEGGKIGIVRHALIYLIGKRIGNRMRNSMAEMTDEPAILITRFKHNRRAAYAPGLKIQHNTNILCPRMFRNESASAQQMSFFSVSEKKYDVSFELRGRFECPCRFQKSGDGNSIIAGPWTCSNR